MRFYQMGEKEIKAYPCMLEENGNTPYSTDFTLAFIHTPIFFNTHTNTSQTTDCQL